MEHRYGKRIRRNMPVELWRDDHRLARCQLNDVGQGGLSLKGVGQPLKEGDLLTLKVNSAALQEGCELECKAMVVYSDQKRLGLMWVDVDARLADVLREKATIAA